MDQNPRTSCVLVGILVKELERAERGDLRHYIIPLLHTLMYTLIQAPCIPDELCARVYDFCKRLLTLPKPFCTIGLDYASRLQVERAAPGTLYQRMVISEQSLPSAAFPCQERIFIFADPELLPEAICRALAMDTEAAQVSQSPRGCMSCVVTHALQAALGDTCDTAGLRARLQALPPGDVEHWFQQVVAAVEGGEGGSDRGQHTARLERIYQGLLGSSPTGNAPQEGPQGTPCTPLPSPNISFHLWTEDEQLWKELVLFLRPLSQSCEPECLGALQFYHIPVVPGQPQPPAAAEHAGPEELCEVAGYLGRADPWYESNINTLCHMIPKLATMVGGKPSHPSRALVTDLFLTDVIAYYARMGTQPVCFQVHSVKVLFQDPAQDPAEDVFLTELLTQVQDSPSHRELSTTKRKSTLDGPGMDLTVTYRRAVLSDRQKELALSLHSTGLLMKAIPAEEAAGLGCLTVTITEIIRTSNLAGRSFSAVAHRFRTCSIKVRSPEQRPFMVRLDKDSRRTYRDVIGLEVSPCLEPSYCLQKTRTTKCSPEETEDMGLVKYLPKSLLLPINTFAGVIP
ncbi:phosphoinositide 3-kinase regulatory subunit 6 [Geospiza fortis]|uniref:Phosphoinositide 3-kinase regulatory subunit 6 n=1 Tax=Geospiza fortis TaxID=48883 RepID=A0A8N5I276_GEOFO|nr:phosphoinositide 3-kinase regulatory subunit 6 [Geospiza fortis]